MVSTPFIRSLENDYPPLSTDIDKPGAIVVLTAGARDLSYLGLGPAPTHPSLARLSYGIELHRKFDDIPLIICGGKGDPSKINLSESEALRNVALGLGISEDMLVIEDKSINTFEGARKVRLLLEDESGTTILVSSASHLGRATELFRKAGLVVLPAPTDYLGGVMRINIHSFIPNADCLRNSAIATYEYLSRIWYTFRN